VELQGSTALVTGASTGIGAATARAMAARGARVLLVARSEDKLAALAGQIGESADAYPCDVGDHAAVAAMAERVKAERGVPDVIVNNAGAGRFLFVEETEPEELVQMTAVPYLAAFFVTRAFVEEMMERGSGWIVNVNTPISQFAWPGALGYAGARWALRGFDSALRADLRGTGVGVTHVVPAKVSSDYFRHNPGAEQRIPRIGRIIPTLTPEQVGEAICAGVERGRRQVVVPWVLRLLYFQSRFLPRLTEWLTWRTGARRERARG
jgi:short-subunit dehydrogenase